MRDDEATMTVGSLFAGIGGLDLGLERAGMSVKWQVEIDPFCRRVLAKHWPNVPRYEDVRLIGSHNLEPVDLICGGFPCQDISSSNHRGKGLDGERSGLWSEFHRIIGELHPSFALIENVPAITFRGLDRVLLDLADVGYDAEWRCLSAKAIGAPHFRNRLFVVAYPAGERCEADEVFQGCPFETASQEQEARIRNWPGRIESRGPLHDRIRWCPEGSICRVADVLPDELDRYRALGNAVVPQVAEWIGRRIMEAAKCETTCTTDP